MIYIILVLLYLFIIIVIRHVKVLLCQRYLSIGSINLYVKYIFWTVLIILPRAPYAWVEVQTMIFQPVITQEVKETMHSNWMSKHQARIYIVSRDELPPNSVFCESNKPCLCHRGDIINLLNTSKGWKFNGDYSTVWSDCGSADGNIFPPYFLKGDY